MLLKRQRGDFADKKALSSEIVSSISDCRTLR
jgi:hypothetical protein